MQSLQISPETFDNDLLISPETFSNPLAIPTAAPSNNTDRMMTKRIPVRERSTVILSFKAVDANAMRAFIKSIRLKGDKAPSQSLIARRALEVYLRRLETMRRESPATYAAEIIALESMVTSVPCPAPLSQRKTK